MRMRSQLFVAVGAVIATAAIAIVPALTQDDETEKGIEKYRQMLNPWFSPGAVDEVTPRARAICRRLIGDLTGRGECVEVGRRGRLVGGSPAESLVRAVSQPVQQDDDDRIHGEEARRLRARALG